MKPRRIQLKRVKGWRKPEEAVVVNWVPHSGLGTTRFKRQPDVAPAFWP